MSTFNAGAIEATLTLDRSPFTRELRAARAEGRRGVKVRVDLDTAGAMTNLRRFQRSLAGNRLEVSTAGAEEKLGRVSGQLAQIHESARQSVRIDVNVGAALAQVQLLKRQIDSLDRGPVRVGPVLGGGGGGGLARGAARTGALGALAATNLGQSRLLLAGLTAAIPMAVPMVAGLTAGLGGLGAALTSVGGGAVALGAGLIGNVTKLAGATERLSAAEEAVAQARARMESATTEAQRASAREDLAAATAELAAAQEDMSPAMREAADALDRIKGAWDGFVAATEGPALGLMVQTLDLVSGFLPRLVPLFETFAGVASGALGGVAAFLAGPESERMLTFFQDVGSVNLDLLLQSIGNLVLMFGRLFEAFGPFSVEMMQGLANMTAGWAEWADGLGQTEGFISFMEYVRETWPDVQEFFGTLWGAVENLGVALAPVAPVLLNVTSAIFEFIQNMDPALLGAIVTGLGAATLAFGALTGSVLLFNVVWKANPISLVVMAIAGLVAAIVYLWNEHEGFRNFVIEAWANIQNAVQPVVDWITGTAVPWLVEAFNSVAGVVRGLWAVFSPVFGFIWNVVSFVFGAIYDAITTVVLPIFGALISGVTFLWTNAFKPVFTFIAEIIGVVWRTIWWFWTEAVGPVFELMAAVATTVWENTINPVFTWIGEKFQEVGDLFTLVWNAYLKPVFDTIMDVVEKQLAPAFNAGMDAVGAAWDRLKDLARAPVRFVVDTVINQGIIRNFNKLADIFGTSTIDYLTLPGSFYGYSENAVGTSRTQARGVQALATGGPVSGYSPTPAADNILARLTAGEYVLPVGAVRRIEQVLGPGVLEYMRRGLPGFAEGGLVQFGRALQAMGYRVAEHPAFGGVSPVHKGRGHYEGRAIDVNWAPGTSAAEQAKLAAIIPLAHEQGFRTIFMAPGHYGHAHIEAGGGGVAASIGSKLAGIGDAMLRAIMNPLGFFQDAVSNLLGGIGGGMWGEILAGAPKMIVGWVADKITSLASGFGDLASGVFDRGGQLLPGMNLVYNGTGQNEPVFTNAQFQSREREAATLRESVEELLNGLREVLGSGRALVNGDLVLQAQPGASVTEQMGDVLFELRRFEHGGGPSLL